MPKETPELPVSPQEDQIQAPSLMNKINPPAGGHKFKILGGIFGVLVFVGAVFGAYKFGQKQVQPVPQPTPVVEATPTPDPTANWKTYTNAKYGYSIKYPEDMFYLEREAKLPRLQSVEFTKKEGPSTGEIPGVELTVYEDEGLSLELWFDKRSTTEPFEVSESPTIFYYKVIGKEEIDLNGNKGIRFIDNQITGAPIPTVIVSNQNLVVSIRGYYFVHDESLQDIYNLMLSTFRFTSEEAVGEKAYCKEPRPEVCTMECIVNPPYICGSDGKSYCSTCQACSNPKVEWYVIQNEPCKGE